MIDLAKQAPGLVSLAKTAAVSLEKHGLAHEKAAVYLVLDHSGSMQRFYANGSVQHLAEQALGLSTNLDDDGTVPVIYFNHQVEEVEEARLDNYTGIIDATHTRAGWGTTDYALAIEYIVKEFGHENAAPSLVIFQSDGEPDHPSLAEQALREASHLPIFWAFIGFGNRIDFLEGLDDLPGRAVDNASFFHARDPRAVPDADLYDGITAQYGQWLTAARAAGIIRNR
ncbi:MULTISPECIES: VWA domain-containing protein [unclassified Streptomyces]|uniref:VWA domain-containing protein n=1 Tax=unclassified Streptomyces TaxID=2593676 RepID=UPI00081D3852|nr:MULTISPECIES: VWA domain-containing protein [unclassified Streptomyces]MYR93069.1 VWA domain-containing protein [Streptomyces sp. SID4937]SCD45957.1 TerF vWA domain-containing protein [Streptomyces sp. ScaeMP-e83]